MISIDVVDMAEETTTNKISPANKVEQKPEEMPPPPPRTLPDTAIPQVESVTEAPKPIEAPSAAPKKDLAPLPDLAAVSTRVAELTAPEKFDAKRPQPKPSPSNFASVLKNLEKLKPQDTETPPDPKSKAPAKPATGALASLSNKLTTSAANALNEQLSRCWNIPAGIKDAENMVIVLEVVVNPDRTVASAEIEDQARASTDPAFRTAAMSALRALRMPECTPLDLPPDRYEDWKTMTVRFDPKNMLGR